MDSSSVPTTSAPSRTTNRIHFSDLSAQRFEDLCLALVHPLHPWIDIRHYGRVGADRGVDIEARERMDDGVERVWFVQCRRYSKASKATLIRAVDDAVKRGTLLPGVYLLVVACDVSRSAHEAYAQYAVKKGVATPLLWTASILEATLRNRRRDLLFTYFGISDFAEARGRELQVSRNIDLKKRLMRDLRAATNTVDWEKARQGEPFRRFAHSEGDHSQRGRRLLSGDRL
jgi:hypothetical protein